MTILIFNQYVIRVLIFCSPLFFIQEVSGSEVDKNMQSIIDCGTLKSVKIDTSGPPLTVRGKCPAIIDFEGSKIARGLKFDNVTGVRVLNFEATRMEGGLTIISPSAEQIILRNASILPFVKIIREERDYKWIDDSPDDGSCKCQQDHKYVYVGVIDANYLRTNSFEMHGVSAKLLNFRRANVSGLIDISRCELGQSSFHQTQALGIDINSCDLTDNIEAAQIDVAGNLTLECSKIRKDLSLWGARIGGMVHLQGTQFYAGNFSAYNSNMGQLGFSSTEGAIDVLRLEKTTIGTIDLEADVCPRNLKINTIKASGIEFEWVDGSLDEPKAKNIFDRLKESDKSIYKKLADAYVSAGLYDLADEAMVHHNPVIGWARWLGGSGVLFGLSLVLLLLCVPIIAWSFINWPNNASLISRIVLAADLLLPDLVSLGAKQQYEEELKALVGIKLMLFAIYRLLGWLIVSIIIYAIVTRANY